MTTVPPAIEPIAQQPQERELKLFVPPSSVARLRTHPMFSEPSAGPLRVARIENRYFDTAGRDLATHHLALRLRRIGSRWMQTLKQASPGQGADSTRGEWEMPVAGPALELARLRDTPLAQVGSLRSLGRRLEPLCTTNFRRESRHLLSSDGTVLEFAFDVGAIAAGRGRARRTLPICEVEIEVVKVGDGASPPDLMRVAARLCRDVPLIPLAASKASRGHRLADDASLEADRVELPQAQSQQAPRDHLAAILIACNRTLLANAHALFEIPFDRSTIDAREPFVHQARVATRRMRSALRTFEPAVHGRRVEALDHRLAEVGRLFGEARDRDVFASTSLARFADDVACDRAGRDALDAASQDQRVAAHRALMDALDVGGFGAATIAVERFAARLRDGDREATGKTLGERVPGWLERQRDRVVRPSRRIAVLDVEQRHALRIEVKRMRYALDLFDAMYEAATTGPFRAALTDLQDRLGRLNDATVAGTMLRSMPEVAAIDAMLVRYEAWFERHVRKQLPKIGALAVAFELTPVPWNPST